MNRDKAIGIWIVIGGLFAGPMAYAAEQLPKEKATPNQTPIVLLESEHLPNPVQLHAKVISGGLPEDEAAFAELKARGIKTIISVDGAKPDVALAEKFGLRYVHLPHGYDGVPENRAEELAKAVRDLPGPIYLHCHHGKHRSPAAAAVACIGAGLIEPEAGRTVLELAGTSVHYLGLFESVDRTRPLEKEKLDRLQAEFPSVAKLPAMAEAMVAIEHTHDHLKALEKANWKTIPEKPALEPVHEALLLREHFTELLRTKDVAGRPERFQAMTKEAESAAQELQDLLERATTKPRVGDGEALERTLAKVTDNCLQCHKAYRDVPSRKKEAAQ